jgi:hypothetical protein
MRRIAKEFIKLFSDKPDKNWEVPQEKIEELFHEDTRDLFDKSFDYMFGWCYKYFKRAVKFLNKKFLLPNSNTEYKTYQWDLFFLFKLTLIMIIIMTVWILLHYFL